MSAIRQNSKRRMRQERERQTPESSSRERIEEARSESLRYKEMSASTRACRHVVFLLVSLQLLLVAPWRQCCEAAARALNFSRQDFPRNFVFGAGTSAYQYEGATDEDGRSPSIWDTFTHAGRMPDKSTGDLAADGYHKYKEDVKLMSDTGLEAYRFSISWSRLIPRGRGPVNPKGLEYYNNLINELVKQGIEIHVTLYHVDFPQILEDEYHGWLSPRGGLHGVRGRVLQGVWRPGEALDHHGRAQRGLHRRLRRWYLPSLPLLGAARGQLHRRELHRGALHGRPQLHPGTRRSRQPLQRQVPGYSEGCLGMNVYSFWNYPFSTSAADLAATQRSLDFSIGWIVNPLVYGDYPENMKRIVGSRLPKFTKQQSDMIRGAADFIGINHYSSVYVSDRSNSVDANTTGLRDYGADVAVNFRFSRSDPPTGQFVPSNMPSDPHGLQCMLEYLSDIYANIPVYVQENGYESFFDGSIYDHERVEYLSGYIGSTLAALRNGANVKGYFVWSFLDVFELLAGYYSRYGIYHVDFEDPELPREPKLSAQWYSKFLRSEIEIEINIETMIGTGESSHAEEWAY